MILVMNCEGPSMIVCSSSVASITASRARRSSSGRSMVIDASGAVEGDGNPFDSRKLSILRVCSWIMVDNSTMRRLEAMAPVLRSTRLTGPSRNRVFLTD